MNINNINRVEAPITIIMQGWRSETAVCFWIPLVMHKATVHDVKYYVHDIKNWLMIISNNTAGSNGNKLSKPQREAQQQHREDRHGYNTLSNNVNTGPWLCDHYKRRCLVKFDCCERYWPCHRCHNNKCNCGRKKLKSRDNSMIKCVFCQREQPVCVLKIF